MIEHLPQIIPQETPNNVCVCSSSKSKDLDLLGSKELMEIVAMVAVVSE